jgi:hypothetical protein
MGAAGATPGEALHWLFARKSLKIARTTGTFRRPGMRFGTISSIRAKPRIAWLFLSQTMPIFWRVCFETRHLASV